MVGDDIADVGQRRALIAGLITVLVLAGLLGWLGVRAEAAHSAATGREMFVRVARQAALDLTTVDYQDPEGDVRRVLESATGEFYERFSSRAPLLVETVTREQSQAVSSVSEAGLEWQSGDEAQVLVAVSVASKHLGGLELRPHELRMRMTVQRVGKQAKVSEVEYVI
ncbi:Mce protein [Mycolicibacter kumamotonensis]|uniref:Mce protein n=1 Tax=Mycolicibacter kumamotonensis TaxID=354243 RepID=A0A1X0E9C4_9MYCO|nr:Mce protein [Mycolicibacter kumamotonensis]ORA81314.1 Mce protein [Mycolicibacter kumamotonensis]